MHFVKLKATKGDIAFSKCSSAFPPLVISSIIKASYSINLSNDVELAALFEEKNIGALSARRRRNFFGYFSARRRRKIFGVLFSPPQAKFFSGCGILSI